MKTTFWAMLLAGVGIVTVASGGHWSRGFWGHQDRSYTTYDVGYRCGQCNGPDLGGTCAGGYGHDFGYGASCNGYGYGSAYGGDCGGWGGHFGGDCSGWATDDHDDDCDD